MSSKDYMLTAEELRLKRQRRRRIISILLALLIISSLGVVAARPTRDAIKGWQSRRHAEKAFALIKKQDWSAARDQAVAAYRLRPTEPQALRAIARLLTKTRQIQALEFWDQLAKIAPLTREDLRDEAAISLFAGDLHRAETVIKQLTARDPEPADCLLDAQLASRLSAIDRAREDCEKVASDSRATTSEQLQANVLNLQLSKDPKAQADVVWPRIEKLAQGKDAASLDALVLLAQRALSVPDSAKNLPEETGDNFTRRGEQSATTSPGISHALESHPLARTPHKLLALDLLDHADPSQHVALLNLSVSQFKNGNADDVAALERWLNSKGEYQRVIDAIPVEQALKGRDAFLQYLDALGALKRWVDIKQLLESERFPLDAFMARMYVARCNAQLGEKTAAENNWQRAIEATAGDVSKLMQVAEFAEKNGVFDVADSAYANALAAALNSRAAYQGRLRIAQASHQTKRIHDLLAAMLKLWPNDTAIQNDEAYTRLLLLGGTRAAASARVSDQIGGTDSTSSELRSIELLAEDLVAREPKSLPHRTLLALARLRAGLPQSALDAYGIDVPDEARTPSAIAVRSATLIANGRVDQAKSLLTDLNRDQLLPEEKALIESGN
jgi:tetratricopeptide (TPR) repeat protein